MVEVVDTMINGKIIKNISNDFTVIDENENIYVCKARGKFRNMKVTPLVGDNVVIDSENKYTYYYSLQNKIESILELLDWECSMFLKKEFFGFNQDKTWWFNYYSRSTYYRLKKKYMNDFLGLFYA